LVPTTWYLVLVVLVPGSGVLVLTQLVVEVLLLPEVVLAG